MFPRLYYYSYKMYPGNQFLPHAHCFLLSSSPTGAKYRAEDVIEIMCNTRFESTLPNILKCIFYPCLTASSQDLQKKALS